jgi:hypothetical protein
VCALVLLDVSQSSFGAKWEEQPVKDAVAKVVADAALTLPSAETSTSISN